MPRPAVIIGLGGTGQWVLTWLKRDLLLSNDGKMPGNVRLLVIDTATRLEAGMKRTTSSGQQEEAAEIGGVTMEAGEFIYVGGDSIDLAHSVQRGELEQIGKWYQADRWLATQAPATFILDDGAGRLRQFGRMAIFKDILGHEVGSKIWRALKNAIETVRSATSEQQKLEIIVLGSFAGGTGSGMFIDIALILRLLAQQLSVHHVLRGFFALPSVFAPAPNEELRARSFAAWRELNRFMVVDPDYSMPLVEYVENDPTFRIRPGQRIFDACYLMDGKRGGVPIAAEPKFGAFPMISEAISAILDNQAGTTYTQWVFTNLAPEYAKQPYMPMYSTIGAYTVQVPAYFVEQASSHRFAQDFILRLLEPKSKPDDDGLLIAAGAERLAALAERNKNQEDPGFAGRQRSLRLMRESIDYAGRTARPTRFHGRIAEVTEEAIDRRAKVVDQLARAAGADPKSPAAVIGWIAYYPDLGDDPSFDSVRQAVMEHMNYNIKTQYSRREHDTEDTVRARFNKIPEDLRTRFGGANSKGEEVEEFYGSCGEALNLCREAHLKIFRQLVRAHLLDILMGRAENAIVARSGKLGYAWDYFDGLVDWFDKFSGLMLEVKRKREELKPSLKINDLSERAKQYVAATANKKIFWLFEHPDVRGAEEAFMQAQQRLMDLRREDILHVFVTETAQDMKAICVEARAAVEHWILHLTTGDDASSVPGLWDAMRTGLKDVDSAHSFDTGTPKVQQLVADSVIPTNDADLDKALRQLQWKASYEGKPSKLKLFPEVVTDASPEPLPLADPLSADPAMRLEIGRQNKSALLGLVRGRFAGVAERTTVAEEIKRKYAGQPAAFAAQVALVSAEPLFEGGPQAHAKKKSNLIRVLAAPNDPFFVGANGLEGVLRKTFNLNPAQRDESYGIQVVGSENPFKLTLVRTDDLYDYWHFAAWRDCQAAYATQLGGEGNALDPVLVHNFAAEQRAAEFERRLLGGRDPSIAYHPLHARVVMLLEDPDALRQFVYLGMLGHIAEREVRRVHRWELSWDRKNSPQTIWLTRGWNSDSDKTKRAKPDIFNAMHGYVVLKRSQEPGKPDRIDYDFAQKLIEQEIGKLGAGHEVELKLLRDQLENDGFVGWLRGLAFDLEVPDRVARQDYADLATVIEMMLQDRIAQLAVDAESKRGPFAKGLNAANRQAVGSTADNADTNESDPSAADEPSVTNNPFSRS